MIGTRDNIIVSVIIEKFKYKISKIKSQKFLFKEKFANPQKIQPLKYSSYAVILILIISNRAVININMVIVILGSITKCGVIQIFCTM